MNRKRLTDREWVEWVEQGPEPPMSPYGRDDIWMSDRPAEGTCVFAARDGRYVEIVLMMRGMGFDSRLAVDLNVKEAKALRDFLTATIDTMDPKRSEDADRAGVIDNKEMYVSESCSENT